MYTFSFFVQLEISQAESMNRNKIVVVEIMYGFVSKYQRVPSLYELQNPGLLHMPHTHTHGQIHKQMNNEYFVCILSGKIPFPSSSSFGYLF